MTIRYCVQWQSLDGENHERTTFLEEQAEMWRRAKLSDENVIHSSIKVIKKDLTEGNKNNDD